MTCCCPHSRSAAKLFSWFAPRYRRRFIRRGFEHSQKQLLAGLEQAGYQGATLLEVGCGVGHLHQTLLERGASTAVGIDLAHDMLEEARRWAAERGLKDRTEYIEGDFVNLDQTVALAEITLLDKVVCCYPDSDDLVHKTLARTTRVYALTYPRKHWFTRSGARILAFFLWLTGSCFRVYVHDPVQIEGWIAKAGFKKRYEAKTPFWLTQVYVRG